MPIGPGTVFVVVRFYTNCAIIATWYKVGVRSMESFNTISVAPGLARENNDKEVDKDNLDGS